MSLADVLAVSAAREQPRAARRSAAARAAAAGEPPARHASVRRSSTARRREDDAAERGLFLAPDVPAASGDLRVHGRSCSTRIGSTSAPGLERQQRLRTRHAASASAARGSCYVPVEHDGQPSARGRGSGRGRRDSSPQLVAAESSGATAKGKRRRSRAPTSHDRRAVQRAGHARSSARAAGDVRVGTVDKFQGQEAPVVIVLADDVDARGRAARDGVPLQREPPQRRDLAGAGALHFGRQPAAVRARLPHAAADAARERVLPLPRARARRAAAAHRVRAPTSGP